MPVHLEAEEDRVKGKPILATRNADFIAFMSPCGYNAMGYRSWG